MSIAIAAALIFLLFTVIRLTRPEIRKTSPRLGIFAHRLFYSDRPSGRKKSGVIYSSVLRCEKYSLTGKPDYIFKNAFTGRLQPVELKSGMLGNASGPYPGDLMQLAAYFAIIEGEFSNTPKCGRIVYGDCMFVVKNTKKLKKRLFSTLDEMNRAMETDGGSLGQCEQDFVKCRYCVCRETVCTRG